MRDQTRIDYLSGLSVNNENFRIQLSQLLSNMSVNLFASMLNSIDPDCNQPNCPPKGVFAIKIKGNEDAYVIQTNLSDEAYILLNEKLDILIKKPNTLPDDSYFDQVAKDHPYILYDPRVINMFENKYEQVYDNVPKGLKFIGTDKHNKGIKWYKKAEKKSEFQKLDLMILKLNGAQKN